MSPVLHQRGFYINKLVVSDDEYSIFVLFFQEQVRDGISAKKVILLTTLFWDCCGILVSANLGSV